ncbi:ribosomal-processing cysteine protease Prp [Lacticaseibacillus suihuaensis]
MIRATFFRTAAGTFQQFTLQGHADAGDYGHDIVCAAVSAVAIGAANSIEVMAGFDPVTAVDAVNGGHLTVTVPAALKDESAHVTQILLESLLLTLTQIEETNPDHIRVKTHNS